MPSQNEKNYEELPLKNDFSNPSTKIQKGMFSNP